LILPDKKRRHPPPSEIAAMDFSDLADCGKPR